MSIIDQKTQNLKNNLVVQINKIFNNTREGGFKTRARYLEACTRFAGFLASEFKLQKFSNIKGKHIVAYVKYMQAQGKSPATIKTDLSGIRYAHNKNGGRNRLPDNDRLDLEKRSYGTIDKAWTKQEIQMAKDWAKIQGRNDVYHAINISSNMGTRLEGTVKVTVNHLREALENGELYVKEKGGLERYVPLTRGEQVTAIKEALAYAKSLGKTGQDRVLVSNIKGGVQRQYKSIQNWVSNNQKHFRDDSIRNKRAFEAFKKLAGKHGYKPRSQNLNFHGLRYAYAQERYSELREKGYSDRMAKKITSENLGHHRLEVVNIYLSKK